MTTKTWMLACGWISLAAFAGTVCAQPAPGSGGTNTFLTSWRFDDTNWLTVYDDAPVIVTNVSLGTNGNGNCLNLDSTNASVIGYRIITATTNLLLDTGSLTFWFRPSWSSTNLGGSGPGMWGRLVEVGSADTNSDGWWSLYLDPGGTNIYFSTATNAGVGTNYFAAPISWDSNVWHQIGLSYDSNGTALYIDGALVTNGSVISYLPDTSVSYYGTLFIGSDSNGVLQAHGEFDDLETYRNPVNPLALQGAYNVFGIAYYGSSFSFFNGSAPSHTTNTPFFNTMGGQGWVQYSGQSSNCATGGRVYFTNLIRIPEGGGTMMIFFDIAGGTNGQPYDVFGCAPLHSGSITNSQWYWLGQGYTCNTYVLTNQPNGYSFYVMGTAQDTDQDGLTDAFELLVSKTDPTVADTNNDGIPDAWAVLQGISPWEYPSNDPDHDALSNYQEYLFGTRPLQNEGFSIWVASPGGGAGL